MPFTPLPVMRRYPNKGNIRPKFSTMPRQASESAALLELYKLTVEKKRLEQELQNLELRRQQIGDRLTILNQQIVTTENSVQQLRTIDGTTPTATPLNGTHQSTHSTARTQSPTNSSSNGHSESFETLHLEY